MREVIKYLVGFLNKPKKAVPDTPSWHGSVSKPGDPDSVFVMRNGMVGFKKYVLAANQDEAKAYSGIHYVVDMRPNVEVWVQKQPIHLWKYANHNNDVHPAMTRMIVNAKLYTLMALRWNNNETE
jgi:hypothetical protein